MSHSIPPTSPQPSMRTPFAIIDKLALPPSTPPSAQPTQKAALAALLASLSSEEADTPSQSSENRPFSSSFAREAKVKQKLTFGKEEPQLMECSSSPKESPARSLPKTPFTMRNLQLVPSAASHSKPMQQPLLGSSPSQASESQSLPSSEEGFVPSITRKSGIRKAFNFDKIDSEELDQSTSMEWSSPSSASPALSLSKKPFILSKAQLIPSQGNKTHQVATTVMSSSLPSEFHFKPRRKISFPDSPSPLNSVSSLTPTSTKRTLLLDQAETEKFDDAHNKKLKGNNSSSVTPSFESPDLSSSSPSMSFSSGLLSLVDTDMVPAGIMPEASALHSHYGLRRNKGPSCPPAPKKGLLKRNTNSPFIKKAQQLHSTSPIAFNLFDSVSSNQTALGTFTNSSGAQFRVTEKLGSGNFSTAYLFTGEKPYHPNYENKVLVVKSYHEEALTRGDSDLKKLISNSKSQYELLTSDQSSLFPLKIATILNIDTIYEDGHSVQEFVGNFELFWSTVATKNYSIDESGYFIIEAKECEQIKGVYPNEYSLYLDRSKPSLLNQIKETFAYCSQYQIPVDLRPANLGWHKEKGLVLTDFYELEPVDNKSEAMAMLPRSLESFALGNKAIYDYLMPKNLDESLSWSEETSMLE